MTRTKKAAVKKREALVAHKPPKKDKVSKKAAARLRVEAIESKARRKAMIKKLLGFRPKFAGKVTIPPPDIAKADDYTRMGDIKRGLLTGHAAVYWVDGSNWGGFLGAGVVQYVVGGRPATSYELGSAIRGCSDDAELFAIAVALELAQSSVQGGQDLRLLRIFSDAQPVLLGFQTGKMHWIGPLHHEIIAVQRAFEVTEWLASKGVEVELVWVKGHSASEGNQMADRAAREAIDRQLLAKKTEPAEEPDQLDVPELWRQLGQHWVAEWEHRVGCKDKSV